MKTGRNDFSLIIGGFLVGGLVGSLAVLLYTPLSGKKVRYKINKYTRYARLRKRRILAEARKQSDILIERAEEVLNKTKDFAEGKYKGSMDSLEKEITALKAGYKEAVETYKNYIPNSKPTDNIVNEIFADSEDDLLPKFEGMHKRNKR